MNRNIVMVVLVVLALTSVTYKSLSSSGGISKEQGDAILQELKSLRKELYEVKRKSVTPKAKPSRPKTAHVSTLGNPVLGDSKAPVTLVEFTDYQCPYCRRFYSKAYQELKKQYVDKGKLRFVLRDLPLRNHQYAKPAAISAHCAGEQNKFWGMHDALFEGGGKLDQDDISNYANSIGLENASFKSCLNSSRYDMEIERDVLDAKSAGIRGTPAFVVGRTTDDFITGTLISGTRSFVVFQREIDKLLN